MKKILCRLRQLRARCTCEWCVYNETLFSIERARMEHHPIGAFIGDVVWPSLKFFAVVYLAFFFMTTVAIGAIAVCNTGDYPTHCGTPVR